MTEFCDISDDDLDSIVTEIKHLHGPFTGRSIVMGHLRSLGIRIQQKRLLKTFVKVDPENSRLRWPCLIKYRKYNVSGPPRLSPGDGHHNLINWGFVIHGAIDDFSRVVVYSKCATNNKSETVLFFKKPLCILVSHLV